MKAQGEHALSAIEQSCLLHVTTFRASPSLTDYMPLPQDRFVLLLQQEQWQ
jgi:hypothetical protein